MLIAGLLESTSVLLTVLTPLVAVPLTVITFYLRSLREHQVTWHEAMVRRVEQLEGVVRDLRKLLTEFERDYTTKEEWLRECMHGRRVLEQLMEATVRIETTMHAVLPNVEPVSTRGPQARGETGGHRLRTKETVEHGGGDE